MQQRYKGHNLSWKQVQQLLEDPSCTKDLELSEIVGRDIYQLPNGSVFLLIQGAGGVVYELREDLVSLTSEPTFRKRTRTKGRPSQRH